MNLNSQAIKITSLCAHLTKNLHFLLAGDPCECDGQFFISRDCHTGFLCGSNDNPDVVGCEFSCPDEGEL